MKVRQPLFMLMGILAVGWCVGLDTDVALADPSLIAKGEKIYQEKKCATCHMIKGQGGKSGGDLTTVGSTRDADWLKRFTKEPKSVMPDAKMPAFKGSEGELDAVVAYMESLK